jgi:hypothetical protein
LWRPQHPAQAFCLRPGIESLSSGIDGIGEVENRFTVKLDRNGSSKRSFEGQRHAIERASLGNRHAFGIAAHPKTIAPHQKLAAFSTDRERNLGYCRGSAGRMGVAE